MINPTNLGTTTKKAKSPRPIRSMLSINTGDEGVFEMDKNRVVLKKKAAVSRNFEKYVGILAHLKGKRPDDIVKQLR